MPAAVSKKSKPPQHDDLDNYDAGDFSDDPFRSPSPDSSSKKRKDPPTATQQSKSGGLGIDEEVSVQKRARVPAVKLDEDRLLGPSGIPTLRKRAGGLKLKGKGHEFSDAARLLSFYQMWMDDMFPKARFLDALAMVEKAGHKKKLAIARNEWISERRSKSGGGDGEEEDPEMRPVSTMERTATGGDRPSTPTAGDGDVPDDDDLYDATPRRTAGRTVPVVNNEEPDEDDLAALMAEAEDQDRTRQQRPQQRNDDADEDDLEALMAEAETHDQGKTNGKSASGEGSTDFAAEEAAMQEMEGLW